VRKTSANTAVTMLSMKRYTKSSLTQYWRKEWRAKVSVGRTMMQALELLQLARKHISGRSDVEQ